MSRAIAHNSPLIPKCRRENKHSFSSCETERGVIEPSQSHARMIRIYERPEHMDEKEKKKRTTNNRSICCVDKINQIPCKKFCYWLAMLTDYWVNVVRSMIMWFKRSRLRQEPCDSLPFEAQPTRFRLRAFWKEEEGRRQIKSIFVLFCFQYSSVLIFLL